MRDYLLDLVSHTYDLGCIDAVKITGTDQGTDIDSIAQDKSVVISGSFKGPILDFIGTFGMPNMDKLKILLNLQEYRENANITVIRQNRDNENVPVGLNFINAVGDFKNDYRFMTSAVVNEQLKTPKFVGVGWNIEFEPTVLGIQRLKMQAQANSDMLVFKLVTDETNLKFSFGDHSTHAGEFIFQNDVTYKLKNSWSYPVKQVISILDLVGDRTMRISDSGAMQITVDSGSAVYNYILPAQSK